MMDAALKHVLLSALAYAADKFRMVVLESKLSGEGQAANVTVTTILKFAFAIHGFHDPAIITHCPRQPPTLPASHRPRNR